MSALDSRVFGSDWWEPPILADAESALLSAYRAMDDDKREDAIEMMQILAKRFPRAPRFRLVAAPESQ